MRRGGHVCLPGLWEGGNYMGEIIDSSRENIYLMTNSVLIDDCQPLLEGYRLGKPTLVYI